MGFSGSIEPNDEQKKKRKKKNAMWQNVANNPNWQSAGQLMWWYFEEKRTHTSGEAMFDNL